VLLRFDDGACGSLVVSQVSAGRKNRIWFEADGIGGALEWDAEAPEQLWLGHRDRPNELHWREPGPVSDYPSGHAEGFPDTFKQLYRAVYRAVECGRMPKEPDFPTFHDGHRALVVCEAIAESARERSWVEVPSGAARPLSAR
jgi:predicted dehydrogenase